MNGRTRGTAYVGVVWVVILVLFLLIACGLLAMVNSDRSKIEEEKNKAVADAKAAATRVDEHNRKLLQLSEQVGYKEESPMAASRPDEIKTRLEGLRGSYKEWLGSDITTLARVVDKMQAQVDDVTRLLGEARVQGQTAENSRKSLEQNLADVTRQKDEAYAELQKQLTTERDRNSSQESSDKSRVEELNRRLSDHETRAKGEKEELEKQLAALNEEIKKREGRIAELAKKVEIIKLPDQPDGSVVGVSTAGTCYLDLGTKDLLRRGTRFKVFTYGKGGEMLEKGMVEVTKVEEAMAEATVIEVRNQFDPIARGDRISAPNYDPKMPREFVLTGRFPGGYSRAMVADRLRALGARVVEKVGPATDFLIVGDKDDAAAPADAGADATEGDAAGGGESEEMKLASLFRVQVLAAREILEYVKYE